MKFFIRKHYREAFAGLLSLLLWSCGSNQPQPAEIVARVGDVYLTREVVSKLVPENLSGDDRKFFIKRIVEDWIDNQVLAAAAREEGIELSATDRWKLQKLEADIFASKFVDSRLHRIFNVTDQEIEDYYKANKEQFKRVHDEVHLVHLYFDKLDRAIVKEIRQTSSLLEVIEKNPYLRDQINPVIEPNGDLGYVAVEQLRPEFERAIRGNTTGTIYGPIRINNDYHYLQVLDRQPAGSLRSIELVKDEIVVLLQVRKRHQSIRMLKDDSRKQFVIETFYNNIP